MTRVIRLLALGAPLAVGVVWLHLFGATGDWAGAIPRIVSALLAGAALTTAWAGLARRPRLALGIATGLLAAQTVIIVTTLAGARFLGRDLFPSHRLSGVVAGTLVLAVTGLVLRRMWARWLALALGSVGALSGTLNAVKTWSYTSAPDPAHLAWSMDMYLSAWILWVYTLGSALVVQNLLSGGVRELFAARAPGTVWSRDEKLIRWLRATLIAAFGAAPMLLVYAWLQPIVPGTRDPALALAALLALAAVLTVRGKSIGALLLVITGAGLLALTAVMALRAAPAQHEIACYYALFWLPAGLLACLSGLRLAAPVWRLLRRGSTVG